jgi:iron complex transport system substrate-binding protein
VLRLVYIALVLAVAANVAAAETPRRIASMNLCADQLVWRLAERRHIVSLSHLAADDEVSLIADEVEGIHLNHGSAEEIVPLKPDLVVAGRYSARAAVSLLRKLGYRVVQLELARSVADIRRQIVRLGEVLGSPDRARRIIARMDRRIEATRVPSSAPRPTAINYQPNGFAAGPGSLIADVLRHAGFDLARIGGSTGAYAHLPLEVLIDDPPDVLIVDQSYAQNPTLAHSLLAHPALDHLANRIRRVAVPNRVWICGNPGTARAIEQLAEVREQWAGEQ